MKIYFLLLRIEKLNYTNCIQYDDILLESLFICFIYLIAKSFYSFLFNFKLRNDQITDEMFTCLMILLCNHSELIDTKTFVLFEITMMNIKKNNYSF